jgi:hypothetical protein
MIPPIRSAGKPLGLGRVYPWEGLSGAGHMQEKRPPAHGLVRQQRQDRVARKQRAGDQAGERHGED